MPRVDLTACINNTIADAQKFDESTSTVLKDHTISNVNISNNRQYMRWLRRIHHVLVRISSFFGRYVFAFLASQIQPIRTLAERSAENTQAILDEVSQLRISSQLLTRDIVSLSELARLQAAEVASLTGLVKLQAVEAERTRASFWGRFDELEIKARPMIAFDEASYAIRLMDGYAMIPRGEPMLAVMVANAPSGGLESGTRRVLRALIEPGMAVADIGANVGLLSLSCAMATGPTGKVYVFEPEPGPRVQLKKTLLLNGLDWVEVFDCAVGEHNEQRVFHVSSIIGHSSLYPLPQDEAAVEKDMEIRVVRLDDIIPEGCSLDVVKIDVEGAELDVLKGMTRLLSENSDIALIAEYGPSHLRRVGIDAADWFEAFFAAGFEAYLIEEPFGGCRRIVPSELATVESVNLAFVRPNGAAQSRLPAAK